jgi:vitamin B12/bleomycin/antimicrobial peptide transport system ATP-binding/permease protein
MQGQSGFLIQFMRLAGPFWNSDNKALIRKQTLALIVLTVLQIIIAVVITEWSAALFNALEQHSMSGLFKQIGLLILIFAASVAATFWHLTIKRDLQIGWRSWLTERIIGQWMNNGRQYLVTHILIEGHDNPDGRIAEDIRIAIDEAVGLCHSLFYSVLILISFTEILWRLSGTVILDLGVVEVPIQGHLVWIAIIYAIVASVLGWLAGRPLTLTTNAMQTVEANFRFGLVKARENSQAIALIHGEINEQKRFLDLFQDITGMYNRQTQAWANILMFNAGYSVLSMAFPILIAAPRYILGSITLGALMQSAQAFQQMSGALSWPVNNMGVIAQWRASVERVLGLVKALEDLEQEIARPDPQRILIEKKDKSILSFHDLCISRLDGKIMISGLNDKIKGGERVLITGNPFTGARLFKAIAGLWPWGSGSIELPDEEPMFFMPPRPYLPNGTLREAICYPSTPESFTSVSIQGVLELAGLEDLMGQLEQADAWEQVLSREQQQRLGLVRLLLYRPKWILMQEAFDSLDPEGEKRMLRLICQQLPEAAMLTITNQPTAEAFHHRKIKL